MQNTCLLHRNHNIHSTRDEAATKQLLDCILDQQYQVLATYKNNKRTLIQKISTPDGQQLILKHPRAQYRSIRMRLQSLWQGGEALQHHLSLCTLQSLGLQCPEPVLAAEQKNRLGMAVSGILIYGYVDARPVDKKNREEVNQVADALLQLHRLGYTRDDPRPHNFLMMNDQPVFIDCKLHHPVLFTRLRTWNEYMKLLRAHPHTLDRLSEKERNSFTFRLIMAVKNATRTIKKGSAYK